MSYLSEAKAIIRENAYLDKRLEESKMTIPAKLKPAPGVDLEFAYDADDRKVRKGDSVLLTHDTALAFGVHVVERVYRKSGVTKVALDFGGRRKLYVLARNVRVFNVEE